MSILRVYFGGHNGVWIDVRTFRFERIEGSAHGMVSMENGSLYTRSLQTFPHNLERWAMRNLLSLGYDEELYVSIYVYNHYAGSHSSLCFSSLIP
jgi:hypothetical protein